ncbi:MAG: GGDEF domain-containing protein [Actinomycetota bacterium]|nr:GGDEF domain-containing protein [Actinomycetota bacterium]
MYRVLADVPHSVRLQLRRGAALTLAVFGLYALEPLIGLGVGAEDWLNNSLVLAATAACLLRAALVVEERAAWTAFGLGLAAWAVGDLYFTLVEADLRSPPVPSFSDFCYLAFYPASYIGLFLLVRRRLREFPHSLWLDGLIGALAVAAAGAAVLLDPLIGQTGGSAAVSAIDLAYPLADILLLGFAVGLPALTGWRVRGPWLLIAAALALIAISDGLFLYSTLTEVITEGTVLDPLWAASLLLLAYASWRPARVMQTVQLDGLRVVAVPALFASLALALLVYAGVSGLNDVALALATAALAAAIARMVLTLSEYMKVLRSARLDALTDAVTGLGNRRKLFDELEWALGRQSDDEQLVLVLMDLDRFKSYNDTYGHPAGDLLLARVGEGLAAAAGPHGSVYRLGGDEFCALVDPRHCSPEMIVGPVRAILTTHQAEARLGVSYGSVLLPDEGGDPVAALKLADERLYRHKRERRPAAALAAR